MEDIEQEVGQFAAAGAIVKVPVQDAGGGIKEVTLADPDGNLLGLIENTEFKLPDKTFTLASEDRLGFPGVSFPS